MRKRAIQQRTLFIVARARRNGREVEARDTRPLASPRLKPGDYSCLIAKGLLIGTTTRPNRRIRLILTPVADQGVRPTKDPHCLPEN